MAVKTSGAEFKRFYDDKKYWPDGTYHDDVVFVVNGQEATDDFDPSEVKDTDQISIDGGCVSDSPLYASKDDPTMDSYFRRWKKEQSTACFVVECSIDQLDALMVLIKEAGGRVRK